MAKFLYILNPEEAAQVTDEQWRIWVKDQTFHYPEGTLFFSLKSFTTDDLLKVKAQIASELENRMDLDDVVEANLEALKTKIRSVNKEDLATVIRQTLDRLEVVKADEKRAKTRLEVLQDDLARRMVEEGESEVKFSGLISASYKTETVYQTGEDGWEPVYRGILARSLAKQLTPAVEASILEEVDLSSDSEEDVFRKVVGGIFRNLDEEGLKAMDEFAILQKRLTSTTLNELVKQGEDLPEGIKSMQLNKLSVKRLNK